MLGGIGAYISNEISSVVRRNGTIAALYGAAGLLTVSAAGYALNAVYVVLSYRYGQIAASLWIAGALFVLAIAAYVAATMVRNRPKPTRSIAKTALVAAPLATQFFASRGGSGFSSRKGMKGLVLAGAVVAAALAGRSLFSDDDPLA